MSLGVSLPDQQGHLELQGPRPVPAAQARRHPVRRKELSLHRRARSGDDPRTGTAVKNFFISILTI